VQRLFFGPENPLAQSKPPEDVRLGQLAILWPLAVLMLFMGLAPTLWLNTIEKSVHLPQQKESSVLPVPISPPSVAPISSPGEVQR
jgi:NADH:ubiquinone oxidoreductase subunit 4 (subunit M)